MVLLDKNSGGQVFSVSRGLEGSSNEDALIID